MAPLVLVLSGAQILVSLGSEPRTVAVGDLSLRVEEGFRPVIEYRGQMIARGAYLQFHSYDWKTTYLHALNSWQGAPSRIRTQELAGGAKRLLLAGRKNGVAYEVSYDVHPDRRIDILARYSYDEGSPPCALEYGVALLPPGAYMGRWCTYGKSGRSLLPVPPTPGAKRFLFAATNPPELTLYSRLAKVTFSIPNDAAGKLTLLDWRNYAHAKLKYFLVVRSAIVKPGKTAELRTTLRVCPDAAVPAGLADSQRQRTTAADAETPAPYVFPLVPAPKRRTVLDGVFDCTRTMRLMGRAGASQRERDILATFSEDLRQLLGKTVVVVSASREAASQAAAWLVPNDADHRAGPRPESDGQWDRRPEGYALEVQPNCISMAGADAQGLWYATRMAYQVLANAHDSDPAHPRARCLSISNWPDHRIRGMHIPLRPRSDWLFLERLLKCLALYHYNLALVEVYDAIKYDKHPWGSAPQAFSKADLRHLIDLGRQYGLEMVPGINSLGHAQEWLFQPDRIERFPQILELMEDANRPRVRRQRTVCPSDPEVKELLFGIYGELIDLFKPRRFFVGLDEVFDWCKCPRCKGKEAADLFADHIKDLHAYFRERDLEMWMFQDMFLEKKDWPLGVPAHSHNTAAALDLVPREGLAMCCWQYTPESDYPAFKHFVDRGLRCIGFTWFQPGNIWGYARYAHSLDAEGMVGTTWSGPGSAPHGWSLRTEKQHLAGYVRAGDAFWSCHLPESAPEDEGYDAEVEIERHYGRREAKPGIRYSPLNLDRWCNWGSCDAAVGDNAPAGFDYGPAHDLSCLMQCQVGMGGVPYRGLAGGKAIALRGVWEPNRRAPETVNGIAVGMRAKALLFLHTCGWEVKNGTPVAEYRMRFEDGSTATQDVVYGRDILAFGSDLYLYDSLDPERAWLAFVGQTRAGDAVRIHVLRWRNPRPEAKIASVDLVSAGTSASPLVLAVTAEDR